MKYNATVLTALALGVVSVRASPVQIQHQASIAFKDPFVECMRQTQPNFPSSGAPTPEELRACFNQGNPPAKREVKPSVSVLGPESDPKGRSSDLINDTALVQARDLADTVQVLGKVMGVDERAACQDEHGYQSELHDEFVWAHDVAALANTICDEIQSKIEETGLHEDGGIAYAARALTNAYDNQSNYLHKGRHLLLTTAVDFFPPANMLKTEIQALASGAHTLCSVGIQRLMDPREGCAQEVKWYVSQKAKFETETAAVGGKIGMFYDGSNNHVAALRVGFSEDSN